MVTKYKCGNETINVEVNLHNDHCKSVIVEDLARFRSVEVPVKEDLNGRYFVWNSNKVYINNWIRESMKELNERIKNNEHVTVVDLRQSIMSDGAKNTRFIVPMPIISYPYFLDGTTKDTLCRIEESRTRRVRLGYKISLVPVNYDGNVISSRDYCLEDFLAAIKRGVIKIVDDQDKEELTMDDKKVKRYIQDITERIQYLSSIDNSITCSKILQEITSSLGVSFDKPLALSVRIYKNSDGVIKADIVTSLGFRMGTVETVEWLKPSERERFCYNGYTIFLDERFNSVYPYAYLVINKEESR